MGYAIEDPLPAPPVFGLIQRLGGVSEAEMHHVFNMGCGLVAIVPEGEAAPPRSSSPPTTRAPGSSAG